MKTYSQLEEAQKFEPLWDQYGSRVYNLAVRLSGSTKNGWLLARSAFLRARRDMAALEGNTPTYWLYRIVILIWLTPYWERRNFFLRWFGKKTIFRETLLASSVDADLEFLSDQQDTLLLLLKKLEGPERLLAVLWLADGLSEKDIQQITPFSEKQIEKFGRRAVRQLKKHLEASGIALPADENGQIQKISTLLRRWDSLAAPVSLKAEIMMRRVTQRQLEHDHIPDQVSTKGAYWAFAAVLLLMAGSWGYYLSLGRQIRQDMDSQIARVSGFLTK